MTKSRRTAALLAVTSVAVATAVLVPSMPAAAVSSGVTITQVQPFNPAQTTQLWIERVAPDNLTAAPTWRVNADLYVNAPDAHSVKLVHVTVAYPTASPAITPRDQYFNTTIAAGTRKYLIVPEVRRFAFPIAPTVRLTFYFDTYDSITIYRSLKEYVDKTPSGGYRFPAKSVSNGYWANVIGHENGVDHDTHHRGVQNQRFAYDMAIVKWNATDSEWSALKPGTTGDSNDDYWTFGTPIYAMADGYIKKCRRDQTENTPGTPEPDPDVEGNHLYIQHEVGEVALYAHFKAGSISTTLCPAAAASNLNIFVKEGQFLGYSGNTGNSYSPHLHLHLADRPGFSDAAGKAQGLPLRFNHATTRTYIDYAPGATPGFYSLTNSTEGALADWSLIDPNPCGWNRVPSGLPEFARHGINLNCYQEEFNDIGLAGYRQVWRQQTETSGTHTYVASVWRPKAGLAWAARHNMLATDYQAMYDHYKPLGYRLTHVDSYLQSGGVRYSAIFTKTTGPSWVAYHGVSSATHQSKYASYTSQGYRPTVISVVSLNGTRYYTALYEMKSVGSYGVSTTVADSNYQAFYNAQVGAGRKLTYIDVYKDGTINRFSVIFVETIAGSWQAVHNKSAAEYQTAYNSNRNAGRLTRAVSAYVVGGLVKYAALWRA